MKKIMSAIMTAMVSFALFGETITLLKSDVWNGAQSFTLAETVSTYGTFPCNWSDVKAPHSGADYVVTAPSKGEISLLTMGANGDYKDVGFTFGGDSLTLEGNGLAYTARLYVWFSSSQYYYQYPLTINDFRLGKWGKVALENSSKQGFNLYGKLTINGTPEEPAILEAKDAGSFFNVYSKLVGAEESGVKIYTTFKTLGGDDRVSLNLYGDTTDFKGMIEADAFGKVCLSDSGLANGKVLLATPSSTLAAVVSDGKTAVVKAVDASEGGTILPMKPKGLTIGELKLGDESLISLEGYANIDTEASGITVTEKLTVSGKVTIGGLVPSDIEKIAVLTAPAGSIDLDNFRVENSEYYDLKLEGNTLWFVNNNYFDSSKYVSLLKDDPKDSSQTMAKYSYHYAGGWSNGLWPENTNDYFVSSGRLMNLMNNSTVSDGKLLESISEAREGGNKTAYWRKVKFYGRSLTVAGTLYNISPSYSAGYSMDIADLRMLPGSKLDFTGSTTNTMFNYGCINNKLTVQSNEANPFIITGGKSVGQRFICFNRLLGDEKAYIKLADGNGFAAFCSPDFKGVKDYHGTIYVGANRTLYIEDGEFGGIVELGATSSAFAFATFTRTSKDKQGIDNEVWTDPRFSGDFKMRGFRTAGSFEWDATDATFSVGELAIGGDLTLKGVKSLPFPCGKAWEIGGVLNLDEGAYIDGTKLTKDISTESGLVIGKLGENKLVFDFTGARVATSVERFRIALLPGTASITDVEIVGLPSYCDLALEGEGAHKALYAINNSYFPAGDDYIVLTADDPAANGEANELYSYHLAGSWSDGLMPTEDKDYFVPADTLINFNNNGTPAIAGELAHGSTDPTHSYWEKIRFYGGSLTLAGIAWVYSPSSSTGYSMKIPDWRVLSGAEMRMYGKFDVIFDTKKEGCKLTVGAIAENPFVIGGGTEDHQTRFWMNVVGDEGTGIRITNAVPSTVSFLGNMSGYKGEISVGAGETLQLGGSYPGVIRLEAASSSVLFTDVAAGTALMFKKLVTSGPATIRVPAGCTLWFEESEIKGQLSLYCDEYQSGQIVLGERSGEGTVWLNDEPIGEGNFKPNGAIFFEETDIVGDGSEYDPYQLDSVYKLGLIYGNGESVADKYFLLGSAAMPRNSFGTIDLFHVGANTEVCFEGQFTYDWDVEDYDQFPVVAESRGERKYVTIKNALIPDSTQEDRVAFLQRDYIYIYDMADSTSVTNEFGQRPSSFANYGDDWPSNWRQGSDTSKVTDLWPEAGHDYVLYPGIYSGNSRKENTAMNLREGDLGEFAGDSLTLCWHSSLRADYYGTEVTFNDLRAQDGTRWLTCGYNGKSQTLNGKLTVYATYDDPFKFQSQVTNGYTYAMNMAATLIGGPTRGIRVFSDREEYGVTKVSFSGDCTQYSGAFIADNGGLIELAGENGAENAAVEIKDSGEGFAAASAISPTFLRSLKIAAGKTIWIRGQGLYVNEAFEAGGSITVDLADAVLNGGMNVVLAVPSEVNPDDLNIINAPAEGEMTFDGYNLIITMPERFSGGVGGKLSPWLVATVDDLKALDEAIMGGESFAGRYFRQTADLTLADWEGIGLNTDGDSVMGKAFDGDYDGNGFAINVAFAGDVKYTGVFNATLGAAIHDLTVNVAEGEYTGVAGLVGLASEGTKIDRVTVNGKISGSHNCGGIAVKVEKALYLTDCTNNAEIVTSHNKAGGIVGFTQSGGLRLTRCVNNGAITSTCEEHEGDRGVGGVIGWARYTQWLWDCVNTASVTWVGDEAVAEIIGGYGSVNITDPGNFDCTDCVWVDMDKKGYGVILNPESKVKGLDGNVPPEEPVEPGEATEVEADSADEAAAKVKVAIPDEVTAAGIDEAAYIALFTKVATPVVGKERAYSVRIVLEPGVEVEIAEAIEATEVEILAKPGEAGKVKLATKPGLFYSVESGAELGAMAEGNRVIGNGGEIELEVPAIDGAKGFYSIRVNATSAK